MKALRQRLKWLFFPGTNLHAHLRQRILPAYFGRANPGQDRLVLDAGCGNGMLTYQSYLRGNHVLGVSIKEAEVARCRTLFNGFLRIPEERLSFRVINLYDLDSLAMQFDEVICSEVLEHIQRDADVCRSFWNLLKPGGTLHLCTPNADHPDNVSAILDSNETGGHVRPGYTLAVFEKLLGPIGFEVVDSTGIGGPVRQFFNKHIIRLQTERHPWIALIVFAASWLVLWLDPAKPAVPFSIYVRALKKNT